MEKKNSNDTIKYIIFFIVSMLFFFVISLYGIYIEEMSYLLNVIALLSITIYAFICERIFRKGFVTRYVVYPIIVIIVYLLCIIFFLSSAHLATDISPVIYTYIIFLTVMIFAFPIAIVFDIVIDARYEKKRKNKPHNKWEAERMKKEGFILKSAKVEDASILVIVLLFMWFLIKLVI